MRWLNRLYSVVPLPDARITTWWHGKMPVIPVTWSSRNIASLTDNGTGDLTLTFRSVYQATPAFSISTFGAPGGAAGWSGVVGAAVSGGSIRFTTRDTGNNAREYQKVSFAAVGQV